MIAPPESRKSKYDGTKVCGKCGKTIFKIHVHEGVVFIEIKCKGCENVVIRKFLPYENGGNEHG